MGSEIAGQMDFGILRYSIVWEDIDLLYDGLAIQPDDRVLSITSAGDNVLNLLLKDPAHIAAVDLGRAQSALLEFKIAAIAGLTHEEFLELLGVTASRRRLDLYQKIAARLPVEARSYWDDHSATIQTGILFEGRLEKYFTGFQRELLSDHHTSAELEDLLNGENQKAQSEFYDRIWATDAFNRAFKKYFGEENMARHGRDPAQFTYVTEDAGEYFLSRFRTVCTKLPTRSNYYLRAFLTGAYGSDLPPYLQSENFDRLRVLLPRITVATAPLEDFVTSAGVLFSKANLSNIFEYMSDENMADLLMSLVPHFEHKSRIAFWNLLVVRHLPLSVRNKFSSLEAEADRLWTKDRSWFYRAFRILEKL